MTRKRKPIPSLAQVQEKAEDLAAIRDRIGPILDSLPPLPSSPFRRSPAAETPAPEVVEKVAEPRRQAGKAVSVPAPAKPRPGPDNYVVRDELNLPATFNTEANARAYIQWLRSHCKTDEVSLVRGRDSAVYDWDEDRWVPPKV